MCNDNNNDDDDSSRNDSLQTLVKFFPIVHDRYRLALLRQHPRHLIDLVLSFFNIRPYVSNQRYTSPHRGRRSTLTILHRDAIFRIDANLLARKEIDGRIRLRRRFGKRTRRRENMILGEKPVLADFYKRRFDSRQRARRHDCHAVSFRFIETAQDVDGARTRLRALFERFDDFAELARAVCVE